MFTIGRKRLGTAKKSSYLLLDRKSHTKPKIAWKGYKTSRFASARGGRKGVWARGWGGRGSARVFPYTHISSFFFWKTQVIPMQAHLFPYS